MRTVKSSQNGSPESQQLVVEDSLINEMSPGRIRPGWFNQRLWSAAPQFLLKKSIIGCLNREDRQAFVPRLDALIGVGNFQNSSLL